MPSEYDINEWTRLADMDLDSAKYLLETMRPCPYEIICFHCQQAAEKYIKALFVFYGQEVIKIHDLTVLAKTLAPFIECPVEILKMCAILTPYAVRLRYPQELPLEEADVRLAVNYAEQIKKWASEILGA